MKKQKLYLVFSIIILPFIFSGCASTSQNELLSAEQSQVQLRNIQSRAYDTQDTDKVIRASLASLQDLDFVIDKADKADKSIGVITATKLFSRTRLTVTVTIRSRGKRTLVRMNAEYRQRAVKEPMHYQNFFAVLSKALFLDALPVD